MCESLNAWASARGCAVAWGPVEAVSEALSGIDARRASGELEPEFFRDELSSFPSTLPDGAWTVVMIAWPVAAHLVSFDLGDRRLEALVPPTYARYRARFEDVRRDLAAHGLPGARLEHLAWPLKATAARLGLVRYGRNNVTYVPGLGSYIQLCGFLTDARLPERPLPAEPAQMLDRCRSCRVCLGACPTQAISESRFLIRAERCLTHLNENPRDWPDGLSASAHHCIFGCLRCQLPCPANPPLVVERTGLEFTAAETRTLLDADGREGRAETGIRAKLAWLGQTYSEPVLGRNLRALVAAFRERPESDPLRWKRLRLPPDGAGTGTGRAAGPDRGPGFAEGRRVGMIVRAGLAKSPLHAL